MEFGRSNASPPHGDSFAMGGAMFDSGSEYFNTLAEKVRCSEGFEHLNSALREILSAYDFDHMYVCESEFDFAENRISLTKSIELTIDEIEPDAAIFHEFEEFFSKNHSVFMIPHVWAQKEHSSEKAIVCDGSRFNTQEYQAIVLSCKLKMGKDCVFYYHGKSHVASHNGLAEIGYLSKLVCNILFPDDAKKPSDNSPLGNRELQCLVWTAQGKTSFEIAKILNLSEHTVNNYIHIATRKLGATNRIHAIAKAIRMDLIQ